MYKSATCVLIFLLFMGSRTPAFAANQKREPPHGSVYVPLDNWVYPALKRLASMGYAPDAETLALPWTRQQCLVLVEEAEDIASRRVTKVAAGSMNGEALSLIRALKVEFAREAESSDNVQIESLYTRLAGISGRPLRDSFHFGQTIANDYGRPFGDGFNTIDGISASGTWGRFSGYFRGEYQQAPGAEPLSQSVRAFIAAADQIPTPPAIGERAVKRFDPLEMYVGIQLGDFNITAGKQSLWWGPGSDSAFHFSNNAEPFYMVRASQTAPILLPGPLRFLGRIRTQLLVGRLSGHQYPPHPYLNAEKITFQLTPDFELGFTRSAMFGGQGHPLTTGSFLRSFFSFSSTGSTAFGAANDPGDRRSGFDFRWRVPKLKRFVTIYSDSLADDEPNPLDSPRRSAWAPGVYLTQLPGLKKLDFRFETYATWLYRKDYGGGFIYWNNQYRDGYTNNGNLLGSWVGRDARAYVASSSYWLSAKNKIDASFRQTKLGNNFIPGGGTQTDVGLHVQWELRPGWLLSTTGQYERYFVPILGGPQHGISAGVELTFFPDHWRWER